MGKLWTPPGSRPAHRASIPDGDVTLADGRLLHRIGGWHERDLGTGAHSDGARFCTEGGLRVIASMDELPVYGLSLHVSMSYADHDPSWADIRAVRDAFYPEDVDACMMLPRAADYVNVMQHCFHLWQTPMVWGIG